MKKIEAINSVLIDILEVHGYSPTKKGEAIVIDKDNKKYPITIKNKEIGFYELNHLFEKFGKKFLVVSIKGFTPGAIELAKEEQIDLWTKEKLEKEIGKSVLYEVGFDEELDFKKNKDPEKPTIENNPSFDIPTPNKDKSNEEMSKQKNQDDFKVFEISITEKDALRKCRTNSPEIMFLELIPFYSINYKCKTKFNEDKLNLQIDEKGRIFVNAISGEIKEFEETKTNSSIDIEKKIDKKDKEFQYKEAKEEAKKFLKEKLSIEKNLGEDRNESIIYEEKVLEPSSSDIILQNIETIFRPVWNIRNKDHYKKIDATNGDLLSGDTGKGVEFI